MTSFTSLSITPLVCNAASKLNWTVYKTTKTVNCKIVNKTLQWFQNKRSSHSRCSIKKGVLKNFAILPAPESLLIKLQVTPFPQNPSGRLLLEYTCRYLKPKSFNLRILASLCILTNLCKSEVYSIVKFSSKISIIYHQKNFAKV